MKIESAEYFSSKEYDKEKHETIIIDDVNISYINYEGDTEEDVPQQLTIKTQNGGGGRYIHFSTDGFSINDIDELISIFQDFKSRAMLIDKGEVICK